MNIFNIGKANQRIAELEAQVQTLTSEVTTTKENSVAVEKRAEELTGQLTTANTNLQSAQGEVTTLKGKITGLEADLTAQKNKVVELQGVIDKPEGAIQKAAAAKAQEILAGVGHQGVTVKPNENPANPKANSKNFTERCLAAKGKL